MHSIDDFFGRPADTLLDPLIQSWKERLERPGTTASLKVVWPEIEVGDTTPLFDLIFEGNHPHRVSFLWSNRIHEGLLSLGIKADDDEQEALRFAVSLDVSLREITEEFGDGFLNKTLCLFGLNDLKEEPRIHELLTYASNAEAMKNFVTNQFGHIHNCTKSIVNILGKHANNLTEDLKYHRDRASTILREAFILYLERRFQLRHRVETGSA